MSDTPRTDKYEARLSSLCNPEDAMWVPSKVSRTLEREVMEQCLLNGKGSEREAALLGKVERLERENAKLRAEVA